MKENNDKIFKNMKKKNIEEILDRTMQVLGLIGIPLTVIGIGIVMFTGISSKDQSIGFAIVAIGMVLLLPIFLIIVIKLLMMKDVLGEKSA